MTLTGSEVKTNPAGARKPAAQIPLARADKPRLTILLSLPIAILLALPIHLAFAERQTIPESRAYSVFLGILLALAVGALAFQGVVSGLPPSLSPMVSILPAGRRLLARGVIITTRVQ